MADLLWTGFQFVLLAVAGLFLLVCVIASWSSDENLPVRMIGFLVQLFLLCLGIGWVVKHV